ncbi:MAG: phosphodiester glycosidase family protein, partial [Spirochaetales bacterium]|nr:phosphodiester glycosidase family protein [Spirochaetales bacterium]
LSIKDMGIVIDNNTYYHEKNCTVLIRPEHRISLLRKGLDIAVVGSRIVGFSKNERLEIPEAGYVINLPHGESPDCLTVRYIPLKGSFGIQVGPPLIDNNILHSEFKQPFFNGSGIKFPPTVYPQGWTTGRAARMGIGTTQEGQPILIWVEGSKPLMYRPGVDSKGVSLSEFALIGKNHRLKDFVNLDGGGSSQVAVNGDRILSIADKRDEKGDEFERPIPIGLGIKI